MSYTDLSQQERLSTAHQAINNSLQNSELGEMLAARSYTPEKLFIGLTLQKRTAQLHDLQNKEYGESYEAIDAYNNEWDILKRDIKDLRAIGRVVAKDDRKIRKYLQLGETLERSRPALITQISRIINNMVSEPTVVEKFTPFGYDIEAFTSIKDRLTNISQLITYIDTEKSEAEEATRRRDEAMDKLDEWMVDFLSIAPIALREKPQYMEMLGVVVE